MPTLKTSLFVFLLLLAIATQSWSQATIDDAFVDRHSFIFPTQKNLDCVYKSTKSSNDTSVFRRVSFDDKLAVTNSYEIKVKGKAQLLSYLDFPEFHTYVFSGLTRKRDFFILFTIVDRSGKVVKSYEIPLENFKGLISSSNVHDLNLVLIAQKGNTERIIVYPYSRSNAGRIFSMEIFTGKIVWKLNEARLATNLVATDKRLIVLSEEKGFFDLYSNYKLQFFDAEDGSLIAEPYFGDPTLKRMVSIFVILNNTLVVLGDEFLAPIQNTNFFTYVYDLDGTLIRLKVEPRPERLGMLYQGLGTTFDNEGNLLVLGESFRRTYLRNPASKLRTTVILNAYAAVFDPGVIFIPITNYGRGHYQDVIENLKILKINAASKEVEESFIFQTERRTGFTDPSIFGRNVVLRLDKKIWAYDPEDPSVPPRLITLLDPKKQIVLTSFGLISYEFVGKTLELRNVLAEE